MKRIRHYHLFQHNNLKGFVFDKLNMRNVQPEMRAIIGSKAMTASPSPLLKRTLYCHQRSLSAQGHTENCRVYSHDSHRGNQGETGQDPPRNSKGTTMDKEEVKKFEPLAGAWWDRTGKFAALHSMNLVRIPLIRDGLVRMQDGEAVGTPSKPLTGLKLLDVGCGGGILSEPLARLGASVLGLDALPQNINMAKAHAQLDPEVHGRVQYICSLVEDLPEAEEETYDGVVASEIIEHVAEPGTFVEACCRLVKPGGSIFFTTMNKTQLSRWLPVFAAERIFRIVPEGTHDWHKFVPIDELKVMLKQNGFTIRLLHGLTMNPVSLKWHWIRDTSMNYALHAVKHDTCLSSDSSNSDSSSSEEER